MVLLGSGSNADFVCGLKLFFCLVSRISSLPLCILVSLWARLVVKFYTFDSLMLFVVLFLTGTRLRSFLQLSELL